MGEECPVCHKGFTSFGLIKKPTEEVGGIKYHPECLRSLIKIHLEANIVHIYAPAEFLDQLFFDYIVIQCKWATAHMISRFPTLYSPSQMVSEMMSFVEAKIHGEFDDWLKKKGRDAKLTPLEARSYTVK
jgi:hypothetical protein